MSLNVGILKSNTSADGDECYTPYYAVDPLLEFIPKDKRIWCPWGKHIVDENTLWKEHTYPSEPVEIDFTEWIRGFIKKYVL